MQPPQTLVDACLDALESTGMRSSRPLHIYQVAQRLQEYLRGYDINLSLTDAYQIVTAHRQQQAPVTAHYQRGQRVWYRDIEWKITGIAEKNGTIWYSLVRYIWQHTVTDAASQEDLNQQRWRDGTRRNKPQSDVVGFDFGAFTSHDRWHGIVCIGCVRQEMREFFQESVQSYIGLDREIYVHEDRAKTLACHQCRRPLVVGGAPAPARPPVVPHTRKRRLSS